MKSSIVKKTKKSSSNRWLKEHFSDKYVKRARQDNFRARSVYKLMEIDKRYRLIKPGMVVVDLGASPGGWSEYAAKLVGPKGRVFALDLLEMRPIRGVEFIRGDFTKTEVVEELYHRLGDQKVDLVLSDMAPNLSGVKSLDQARSQILVEEAFSFSKKVLKPQGSFLIKVFHGSEFADFLQELRKSFQEVKVIKPDASRSRSSEVYVLLKGVRT